MEEAFLLRETPTRGVRTVSEGAVKAVKAYINGRDRE